MDDPRLLSLQLERLTPQEAEEALDVASIIYIPIGSLEFHGAHLPIGLDALKVHGLCRLTAARTGGLVLPPLYYGTGGGHTAYPWTIMMEDDAAITALLNRTLERLADWDVRLAVILTGHFPGEQVEMVKKVADGWSVKGKRLRVLGLHDGMLPNPPIAPDHAALYETSMMMALNRELVQMERLPGLAEAPANDPGGNAWGVHRHQPEHPLFGIFGPDPRVAETIKAAELLEKSIAWLAEEVRKAYHAG